jgi:hypothetical protein
MLLLLAVSFGMFVAVGCRVLDRVLDDLGCLDWSRDRADAATAATARYAGAPYEYARLLGPGALTTRELERLATQALIEERERRLQAMVHESESKRFRRAG